MNALMSRTACTLAVGGAAVFATNNGTFAGEPASGYYSQTLYRLNSGAEYLEGCFDPCACPVSLSAIDGTFLLGPAMPGNAVDFREVSEVNWVVTQGNSQFTVTGSGMYRITNYGPPVMHALDLELSINGGPVTSFFSDFALVDSNDGSIDLAISMNGMYCYDIVVQVDASPVTIAVTRYSLGNISTYQQGCFDPCDCPLQEPRSLIGGFGLVPLVISNHTRQFAITQVRFHVRSAKNLIPPIILTGHGRYTVSYFQNQATQRMLLTLHDGDPNSGAMEFDSGDVPIEVGLPRISITVDMNGQVCFDTVLDIHAGPLRSNSTDAMFDATNAKAGSEINAP